jgi:ferredoxin
VRVEVDLELCESNAICIRLAPEVFHLDDDMLHILREDVTPDLEPQLQDAVRQCPRQAITLTEGGAGGRGI